MLKIKLLFFVLLFSTVLSSQNIDSLYRSIVQEKNDSIKVSRIINEVVEYYVSKGDYIKANLELNNAQQFVKHRANIAFKLKVKEIELLLSQENYDAANDSAESILKRAKYRKNNYEEGMAFRLKAHVKLYSGNLDECTQLYFQSLSKFKESNFLPAVALAYSDIGGVNYYNEHFDKAAEYWEKSIELYKKLGKPKSVANDLSNLGITYLELHNSDKAEKALNEALEIAINIHDESVKASVYSNLTRLEYDRKNYKKAIDYNNLAASYYESVKNYNKLSNIYSNSAELARSNKQYQEAIKYINKAFETVSLTDNKLNLTNLHLNKSAIYFDLGDYKQAYESLMNYMNGKDSIVNIENQKNINELEKKYQLKEQKKENELLNEQLKTQEVTSSKMRITIILISILLLTIAGVAVYIIKQNRVKSIINQELSEKNAIINKQKNIVEEQNQDITDSIKYAKRIQSAILPPRNLWQKILPDSFVLYLPKDVLSGDFYWIEETKDYIYVAAADCTGHGVPGALISIVNYNLLNKAVLEKNLITPSEILDSVNLWLTESLHQTYRDSAVRDGMDISLIAIHKHSNKILFAGANNPIYLISKGALKQIKGDKFPVGAFVEDKIQKFTSKEFTVSSGDILYLFSDGFADQFGGQNGKKYKYASFQEKLLKVSNLHINEQRKTMKEEFNIWKGNLEQVDDVLLVGIKIS